MRVRDLSPLGGIEVTEVDLSRPRPTSVDAELSRLYERYGLLVFRDQALSRSQLVKAADPFGGAAVPAVGDDEEDAPGLTIITTRKQDGPPSFEKEEEEVNVGKIGWHTDQGYITAPNRGKLIYAVEVPERGGLTGFIDGYETYDGLADATRLRIAGLHVVQSWRHAQATIARNRDYRKNGEETLSDNRFPDVLYSIAQTHPNSGRKVLNLPPLWASEVAELPGERGLQLLAELMTHIEDPRFAYWHQYRPGDVVAWDNWRFLHAASGTPPGQNRTLWSVVIGGGPVMGELREAT